MMVLKPGAGKEDITITVKKKDTQEVEDSIKASLKLYNESRINVGNATFGLHFKILLGLENPDKVPKAPKILDALPQDKSKEYQEKLRLYLILLPNGVK